MNKRFDGKGLSYIVRPAVQQDAKELSAVRVQIDGETEYLDREKGEGFIDEAGFRELIKRDSEHDRCLFLVAVARNRIVGFSRCAGQDLKRFSHQVEFGVCVLKEFWGYGIGKRLLNESIVWADAAGIQKMTLRVSETNERASALYQKHGFKIEGILKKNKRLSDGTYNNTIVMGRWHNRK
ncbi:GNAT family acetyltransferase [Bacillus sp. CPSM8]|uniref:GNAT family N-acetyltransferase n=1 Tax=Bacillus TaxID=1386 RepID=UPI00039EAA75|nr:MULTISPECIES: GNAT family N-acetyltransferase [Bacillus]ETB71937.1 GNAT family acetyltransferase [Bacillus sp. CPSM8]MCY1629530.1 GNAT family N-acetyltransferase [Bacillus paralicheniformis]